MNRFFMPLVIFMMSLAGCTSAPPEPADIQPHLNELPVLAIYYDDTEEPVGYGKYQAFLFLLPNDQFVILRNRDNVEIFLSNLANLEAEYPSTKEPIKFTRNGNLISGQRIFDHLKTDGFVPHIYYTKYEGEFQGDTLHLRSLSGRVYPDGQEKKGENITWDFRKLREY
ncbi:hypothetical protein ACPA1H_04860 [Ectopseudomonas chengduensis]|jgi:hypothetical protein|uniref:hypothetical protein n=1 Tax=Ectopseudomonas chengduensis TaxID=489632 RepID=UPI001113E7C7|nr:MULTISPECIES: hypothetical protein [Pseudomonas]MBP3064432.1 hypothetical protein [Pseudomonas chengduensis]MDH1621810.1 hypothetical protein [Pseudomonas chengduensis]NNB75430.1 hypothetical protein [Pseudomonas chengduensis]